MARGKEMSLANMYVFDLESCDHEDFLSDDHPRQHVWLCGYQQLESGAIEEFTSLRTCLIELFKKGGNANVEIGVHNLSFDGSFLVPELIQMGYVPTVDKPKLGEFSVLIDNRNNWYSLVVKVGKVKKFTFWDTAKLFPMKLEYIHTVYGTKAQKILEDEEFYNAVRGVDYQPTYSELKYFRSDLDTLREVLLRHIELEGSRFRKTQASQAWKNFTDHFPAHRFRFPPLTDDEDKFIRKAYNGGISYVSPLYEGVTVGNVIGIDENSEYPGILAYRKLPYGDPVKHFFGSTPTNNYFWVTRAIVKFTLKEHCVPCIAKRSVFELPVQERDSKWLRNSWGLVELTFTSIDYQAFQLSYDFEVIQFLETYMYRHKVHKELTSYVEKNNEDKVKYRQMARQTQDEHLKSLYNSHSYRAKINNNAFYGKFGEDIIKLGKTVHVEEDLTVSYVEDREEVTNPFRRKYLPVACAVTAYARYDFVQMANTLGIDFIYGDTDSNYLRAQGWPKVEALAQSGKIQLDGLKLGAWDREHDYKRFKALRSKAYIAEHEDGTLDVTLAGCPADAHSGHMSKVRSCFTFDNFHLGSVIKGGNGKLRSVLTATGKRLVPVDFEIKVKDTYYGTF